jgi:uncharacterized protein
MKQTSVSLALGFFAASAIAASFDCTKAAKPVEKAICRNPTISSLDSRLGAVYSVDLARANEQQKERLIKEQKHWLRFTRDSCRDETCLKHAYWSRLAEVETFFNQRPPIDEEAKKSEFFKKVIADSHLYLVDWSRPKEFCSQIFDALKTMNQVSFVKPLVQTLSYEDEALDPWKQHCQGHAPLHFSYRFCGRNIPPDSDVGKGGLKNCEAGYGLPPFKLFELPPTGNSDRKRHVFYSESDYGPMNGRTPKINGGGASGYQQIDVDQCKPEYGYSVPTSRAEPKGSNESAIVEFQGQYYVLTLESDQQGARYSVAVRTGDPSSGECVWAPVVPKMQQDH